jgi:hypothetical protein
VDLPMIKKFKIKYDFECIEQWNNFIHGNLLGFKMDFELQFGEIKVCLKL